MKSPRSHAVLLALVRQIAQRHGGTARYVATGDRHNRFSLELPLLPAPRMPLDQQDAGVP